MSYFDFGLKPKNYHYARRLRWQFKTAVIFTVLGIIAAFILLKRLGWL
jgi:hypothetical protein